MYIVWFVLTIWIKMNVNQCQNIHYTQHKHLCTLRKEVVVKRKCHCNYNYNYYVYHYILLLLLLQLRWQLTCMLVHRHLWKKHRYPHSNKTHFQSLDMLNLSASNLFADLNALRKKKWINKSHGKWQLVKEQPIDKNQSNWLILRFNIKMGRCLTNIWRKKNVLIKNNIYLYIPVLSVTHRFW